MKSYKQICTDCGASYAKDAFLYLCPNCSQGENTEKAGILRIEYNYQAIKGEFSKEALAKNSIKSQGRYIHLLPIEKVESLPPLEVGPTPLDPVIRLREKLGLKSLYVKNDTTLPTGSFKDRASSIIVAKARELKKEVIATASTGNAATALAGMSASVGQKSVIFVPANAPQAKLTQIAMFGAKLIPVKGTYDDAFELCLKASEKYGWYNRNTGYNPYTIEGKKTAALEIWEQLGYKAPDKVFIPTGDGVILAGTYKGFYDLKQMGLIEKIPAMIPVQAEGSAAIVNAFEKGKDEVEPLKEAKTIADSISVSSPACGKWALSIVKETAGFGVKVSDEEILSAIKELAVYTGIFAEPAAAAAYAGLKKCAESGRVRAEETIVMLITGTGLKDIPTASKAVTIPNSITPELKELTSLLPAHK